MKATADHTDSTDFLFGIPVFVREVCGYYVEYFGQYPICFKFAAILKWVEEKRHPQKLGGVSGIHPDTDT
jgi:hypothetical protein